MDGGIVLLWMVAFAFFCFWLSVYIYGLYCGGKWLAARYRLVAKPLVGVSVIAALALAVDLPVVALHLQAIHKLTLMFGLWLVHAQPLAVGYWVGYESGRKQDLELWARNAESWITDFEERPPEFMRDFEGTSED